MILCKVANKLKCNGAGAGKVNGLTAVAQNRACQVPRAVAEKLLHDHHALGICEKVMAQVKPQKPPTLVIRTCRFSYVPGHISHFSGKNMTGGVFSDNQMCAEML